MNRPLASVVLPTFNQAATLPETLESLRRQTLSPELWELIVVDDGSTDETPEILSRHEDWLCVIRQPNQGLPTSCNVGLRLARGKYLARIDSDDLVAPDWLKRLTTALEEAPSASCAVPDRMEWDGQGRRHVRADLHNLYSLIACGTLFRTEMLRVIGGYRPFYWEEYDLYLRLRTCGGFLHVATPLYTYRRHILGLTHSRQARQEGWRQLAQAWGMQALREAGFSPELEEAVQ